MLEGVAVRRGDGQEVEPDFAVPAGEALAEPSEGPAEVGAVVVAKPFADPAVHGVGVYGAVALNHCLEGAQRVAVEKCGVGGRVVGHEMNPVVGRDGVECF